MNEDGEWNHCPWWKVVINTPLRWLQRGRRYNLLIYTQTAAGSREVAGYGFGWIEMKVTPPSQ